VNNTITGVNNTYGEIEVPDSYEEDVDVQLYQTAFNSNYKCTFYVNRNTERPALKRGIVGQMFLEGLRWGTPILLAAFVFTIVRKGLVGGATP